MRIAQANCERSKIGGSFSGNSFHPRAATPKRPFKKRPKFVAAEVTRRIFKANSLPFSAFSRRRLLL